jgi:hypothetical protein
MTLLAVTAALTLSGSAFAQKKPGGGGGGDTTPVPAGTIHFSARGCWTMNADGSNKEGAACMGIPSHRLYAGARWFLTTWPNPDSGAEELAIVREDGDPTSVVYTGIAAESVFRVRWAKDDSFVSFSGGPTPSVAGSENAIYVAPVVWDADGAPSLTSDFVATITGTFTNDGPELGPWFDWSPDGLSVVYVRWTSGLLDSEPLLSVAHIQTGNTTVLAITSSPMEWSPDGTRIAVHLDEWSSSGIYTITPDSAKLVQVTSEGKSKNDFLPVWSPDSKYIAFGRQQTTTKGGFTTTTGDVYRVPAGGGSAVNLTGDMSYKGTKWPNAWR